MAKPSLRQNDFPALAAALPRAVQRLLAEHAALAAGHMQAAMDAPKHGTQYPGQPAVSSAPGEAPAKQTGALYDAITSRATADGAEAGLLDGDSELETIGATLEEGNLSGTLAARPWFGPAIDAVEGLLDKALPSVLRP